MTSKLISILQRIKYFLEWYFYVFIQLPILHLFYQFLDAINNTTQIVTI